MPNSNSIVSAIQLRNETADGISNFESSAMAMFKLEVNVSSVFKSVPHILIKRNRPEFWEKKLKNLTRFGHLEDDIKDFVTRHPPILKTSMDKVQESMDSLIKPRHKVLSALSGFATFMHCSLPSKCDGIDVKL